MKHFAQEAFNRVRSFFRRTPLDQDLNEEMASHLEMAVDENMRRGMSREEARRQALVQFGGLQQARERHRESRGLPWIDVLAQDLRFAFRTLRHDAGFTVVNTILLRPLPFPEAHQLVRIVEKGAKGGESVKTYTADATEEFERQNRSFQSVSGYFAFTAPNNFKLSGNGQPLP